MNFLYKFLLLGSLYIAIAGGFILLIRQLMNQLKNSQVIIYKLWFIFIIGFIVIFISPLLYLPENPLINLRTNLMTLPTIAIFKSQTAPYLSYSEIIVNFLGFISVYLLLVFLVKYFSFRHKLRQNSEQKNNQLFISPLISAPLAFGTIKPKIYIPISFEQDFTQSQQKLLIAHEQTHCDRKDPLILILFELLTRLFWFHPVIYLLNKRMKKDQELSCDEIVLIKHNKRLEYSKLLLTLNQSSINQPKTELYCSSTSLLKERIMKIKNLNNHSIINNFLSHLIILSSTCGLLITTSSLANKVKTNNNGEIKTPETNVRIIQENNAVKSPPKPSTPQMITNPKIPMPNTVPNPPMSPPNKIMTIIPLSQPRPHYPRKAALAKITGYVDVQYEINPQGNVDNIKVISSEPAKVFDKQAVSSVKLYKFKPIAKKTTIQQRIKFNI